MSDVFSKAKRSEVMARIRSRGNKDTEMRLMAMMREQGISGWRRHVLLRSMAQGATSKAIKVRPDFVFRRERVAVFVGGASGMAAHVMRRDRSKTASFGMRS